MSWAAVRGGTPEAVCDALALRATGVREEIPESEITGTKLPGDWYMVVSNRVRLHLTSDEVLRRLSSLGEVIVCFVEEHVMFSSAACWHGGCRVWSVQHDAQKGIQDLKTEGELPRLFTSIADEMRSKQAAAGGRKAGVDYIFDVPVALAQHFTGYRHDVDIPALRGDAFEVLVAPTPSEPQSIQRRSLWKRFFGG